MNRKPTFFTSDWHIGHSNVLLFDERPFKSIEEMHFKLIKNYNAIVPENGICYHLGDVGMAKGSIIKSVLDKLNGTKVLVLGNHDGNVNRMYNCGFDVVVHGAVLYIGGEEVTMTHCPLRGVFREDTSKMNGRTEGENWHKEHKHTKFSIPNRGQFHLHGHIHARKENKKPIKDGRQWDVGVCGNNYRPVHIKAVESWIATYKKDNK